MMTMSNLFCLICDATLDVSSCINIFYTSLPRSGELLANFMPRVLRVNASELRSCYVCTQCCHLFQMLEQAQRTVVNIRCEILKIYRSNEKKKSIKQISNDDNNLGLNINVAVKETCMGTTKIDIRNDQLNEQSALSLIQSKETEKQKCVPDKIISQDLNTAKSKSATENDGSTNTGIIQVPIPWNLGKISKYSLMPLKYSCPTCGKKWKTSQELKTHINTHSTLRPYMCEKCGQAYKHKHALEIHVGMHNGINPFQCTFCKKSFTQKGALMRHLPMHTGEMPYQCELCGKRFIHHTSYNMHRLSHTGTKSYKCHMCDLSLLSTSHLKRHMRVHTGEKPYSCTLCGKRFAERYNLCAHQKIHDSSENKGKKAKKIHHKCNHCNLVFEKKQNFDEHVKYHSITDDKSNIKKSGATDNQAKIVFLQNSLADIDQRSFAVTFADHKMALDDANYNASLQVIIESSDTSVISSNQLPIDKTHT